jgi:aminoglycoside 2''-phosphotransferase
VRTGLSGRFNDVLVVNSEIIFRFPRYDWIKERLPNEIAVLRAIRNLVSLPIPEPIDESPEVLASEKAFIRYPIIPGRPLWREIVESVDGKTLDFLITQLATFLRGLHNLPTGTVAHNLPNLDSRDRWAHVYSDVRENLFPYMRPDSRAAVAQHFEAYLDDLNNFEYLPTIRHGDPGPGNVLFDPASSMISGIIDFDFTGLGDPAVDWSIVLAPCLYGEVFVQRFRCLYPVTEATLARAKFYRGTWRVQEALRTMEAGAHEAFDREIAVYR